MPAPWKPLTTRPLTVLPLDASEIPSPAKLPPGVISITGCAVLAPGCDCWLKPSITTEEESTGGSGDATAMVHEPVAAL